MSVDVNSGFSSLSKVIIERILKDEAPKAPVYLYSINNDFAKDDDTALNEEEMTNRETRNELIGLNQSLLFGELQDIELVVPFDKIRIGKGLKKHMSAYTETPFCQSGI